MKIQDITKTVEEAKQRLDPKCWDGYKKAGTKVKGGVRVNNCVPEGLNEFAPGSGGGESGRWYTDDEMTDLVGDGWYEDMDVSGNIPKQQMIQQAQTWLDDQGYSVQVLNAKLNDDDMDWFIQGSFHNPNFAKKGVAEGFKNTYSVGDRVDGPLGAGTIVAVSKNVNADGRVKVKLDDPSRAGEDGKYKDSFVLDTTQLTHINESVVTEAMLEETYDGDEFFEAYGELWYNEDEQLDEAEYQGRSVPLGKPMQGDVKKFKVYVKDPSTGNVKKVNFGDPNMTIKKSNPARRRSFRARHNCDNPGPRTKARYWSCRKW